MRLFAQLSWYFRREWRRYLGAVALLIIIAILQLVPPKVVGYRRGWRDRTTLHRGTGADVDRPRWC